MMPDFKTMQETFGLQVREHIILAPFTTFHIGGPADYFLEVRTQDDLAKAIIAARELNLPFFILGGGSNVLIGDKGFRGLVIKNSTHTIAIKGAKGAISAGIKTGSVFVEADSGVPFNLLVRFTIDEGLQGLEMHLGLPGSVGGAIFMNSKWMRSASYVGDVVYQARIVTPINDIRTVAKEYFHFQQGKSALQKSGDVILSVVFELQRVDSHVLWETANKSIEYRKSTQPQGVNTAGCIYKNITPAEAIIAQTPNHTTSSGYLIDHAGCKDLIVGGASVSSIHANFIVNTGNATATDVLQLMGNIQERVLKQFGVTLKEEVLRIGEF
jgi:UDP-N-acetylenolpyruvoylglucosamine reductase